ncbi:MAG: hypothetical protein K8T26_14550 [Lentisphaerae bacterium]|nr:hypothetical protein [Lentisphaerota bacterium]
MTGSGGSRSGGQAVAKTSGVWAVALGLWAMAAAADERKFGYVYEADVLPKGQAEFEQWVTARAGKDGGRYARWDFREELEYGLTERLTTALYLNFEDEFSSGVKTSDGADSEAEVEAGEDESGGVDFAGLSSEWKYQLLSPYRDVVGVVVYVEGSSDLAHETELEEKLVLSKNWERWVAAANVTVEQEWEYEDGESEKEGVLELTAGLSRKVTDTWSVGLEARNHREFENNFEFKDEEHRAYFLGPNVAYANGTYWATLSVLPQIYGEGEHATDNLILDEHERVEVRLLAGVPL